MQIAMKRKIGKEAATMDRKTRATIEASLVGQMVMFSGWRGSLTDELLYPMSLESSQQYVSYLLVGHGIAHWVKRGTIYRGQSLDDAWGSSSEEPGKKTAAPLYRSIRRKLNPAPNGEGRISTPSDRRGIRYNVGNDYDIA